MTTNGSDISHDEQPLFEDVIGLGHFSTESVKVSWSAVQTSDPLVGVFGHLQEVPLNRRA